MTLPRGAALAVGTVLVGTLLAVPPRLQTDVATDPAVPPPLRAAQASRSPSSDFSIDLTRLRGRRQGLPAPVRPRRNPFEFPQREVAEPSPRERPTDPAPIEPLRALMPEPALALIGLAEEHLPDGVRRRAILRGANQILLVAEGDEVLGRFLVTRIEPAAVELQDRQGGGPVRLVLK